MREQDFQGFLKGEAPLVRQLMWRRGFRDEQAALQWLHPEFGSLPQNFESMLDMNRALRLLLEARDKKTQVLVYGDYDVDGSTATSVLCTALKDLGWNIEFFIPRRIEEGYGLSLEGAKRILQLYPKFQTVVTVDCGISSFEGIELLKSVGKQVIVTDHHSPPSQRVKADAVINPKQASCPFEGKTLAGVGVAFFLVLALRRALEARDYRVKPLLAYVALGSLCDMVPLDLTNRILVRHGLKELENTNYTGLKALTQVSQLSDKTIRSDHCGFGLGPRINAVGRVGDPRLATELLLETNWSEALSKAVSLDQLNRERREMQKQQVATALESISRKNEAALVVSDESFHLGIVGLVASNLAREKNKVSCVMAPVEDEHALADFESPPERIWKASLRGLKGLDLAKLLQLIQRDFPELLLNAGGHSMAAGLSLFESKIEEFKSIFVKRVGEEKLVTEVESAELELYESTRLDEFFDLMEPFGTDWPKPKILVQGFRVQSSKILKERHLKLFGEWQGENWSLLQFNSPWANLWGNLGAAQKAELDFVGELTENDWRGKKTLEFLLSEPLRLREGDKDYGFVEGSLKERTNEVSQGSTRG